MQSHNILLAEFLTRALNHYVETPDGLREWTSLHAKFDTPVSIEGMVLPEKELKDLASWTTSYGKESADRREYILKARLYSRTYLESKELHRVTPFRCYNEGTDSWRRKDGKLLTQVDLDAISASGMGQGSKIIGKVGDLEVKHEWFIDSSD